jgi:hypothetical protein
MTTLENAVYRDVEETWNLNDFESEETNCTCADKLHVWLHVLDPSRHDVSFDYKHRKAENAIKIIVNKSSECLVCGHIWSSTHCNQYLLDIERLLQKVKADTNA